MKQVVYTASPESQEIHVWSLSNSGELSLLQVVEVEGPVQPMTIHPKLPVLYSAVKPDFRVLAWKIAEDGRLTFSGQAPLPGNATHLSTDHKGNNLFAGYYHDGLVSSSPLDDQGLPKGVTQTDSGLDGCHSANIDNQDNLLYVPALKQDRICVYRVSEDGHLDNSQTTEITTAKGAGPRHMTFHPQGKYAYAVNELDSTVLVLRLTPEGGEIVQCIDMMKDEFDGTRWAADIHITPNGKFLYACDRTDSSITVFQVSATGDKLKLVAHQATELQPRGFNIDTNGEFLVSSGQKSHHISVYRIDAQSGFLTPLERYAVGQGPMWVLIHALDN